MANTLINTFREYARRGGISWKKMSGVFWGDGAMVNSRAVWNGQDYYGFSLLPVGYSFQGKFYGYGEFARAWLPALSKKRDDMGRTVLTSDTDAYTLYDSGLERYGYQPVRCTKDY